MTILYRLDVAPPVDMPSGAASVPVWLFVLVAAAVVAAVGLILWTVRKNRGKKK